MKKPYCSFPNEEKHIVLETQKVRIFPLKDGEKKGTHVKRIRSKVNSIQTAQEILARRYNNNL